MSSPVQLTPAVLASLRIPAAAAPNAAALLKAMVGQTLEATLESAGPEGLLLRLPDGKELVAQGSLSFPLGSLLGLKALPLPGGAGIQLQVVRATPPPSPALLHPLAQGEAAPLMARLQSPGSALDSLAALLRSLVQAGPAAPEQPGTWSTWMKEAVRTLADPAASPSDAAFHRLQAQEGTGWFEIPLPWTQGEPLRLWIEADANSGREGDEAVHRVFLSVPFSTLGDVRLGLEQRAAGLRVRVWLQDPAQLEAERPALEAELASLGRPVDLQILPLPPGAPDLRALAGGSSLSALG